MQETLTRLETERLTLRPFEEGDFPLLLRLAQDADTVRYLYSWGHPGVTPAQDARRFLDRALTGWAQRPVRLREYCVVRKADQAPLGDGSIETLDEKTAEIGWILLPEHRKRGYAVEMGRALLRAGFEETGAERIIAHCDARNAASYRVMERLGMAWQGTRRAVRPEKTPGGPKGDEVTCGITRRDWARATYDGLSCDADDFPPLPDLDDGSIRLICHRRVPADPVKQYVPAYHFLIDKGGQTVGRIDLRLGYPLPLFYAGQIGYAVEEAWRGRGYAGAACRLLRPVMRAHGMKIALITNDVHNLASRRVCEKAGAKFWCRVPLPADHPLRREDGQEAVNVFALYADE